MFLWSGVVRGIWVEKGLFCGDPPNFFLSCGVTASDDLPLPIKDRQASLMVIFVFVLAAPAILQGIIASNEKVIGPHVMRGVWKTVYWIMPALVVASGVLALPTLFSVG